MDKYSSQLSYWVASLLAAAGAMTLQDWAVLVGILVAVLLRGELVLQTQIGQQTHSRRL